MLQQINTENFQQMLSQFSTTELEGMIEKFPYFQQAHLLLAKKYQQENNPRFDQQLQLAALYIQDRELLYNLFNEKNVAVSPVISPVKVSETQQEQRADVEPVIEQQQVIMPLGKVIPPETVEVSSPVSIDIALAEIKQSIGAIQKISEENQTKEPVQTLQPVSEIEVPEITETAPVTVANIEEKIFVTPEVLQPEIEEKDETAEEKVTEEIHPANEKPAAVFSRYEPHTFDEWLKAFNNRSGREMPEKPETTGQQAPDKELTQLFAENITVDYLHGLVKEETNYAKGLERFIEEQIQRHKQPEIKKKVLDKEPDNELVTETMAKVYEMQKKYGKAIDVYEALALKFPEKSSLFAARINFLKNIL